MSKKILWIVLLAFVQFHAVNSSAINEEEEEAEFVANSANEHIVNFEQLPENIRNNMSKLLPYLPAPGDAGSQFFFTKHGNDYKFYKNDIKAGKSAHIGTFVAGGKAMSYESHTTRSGLYYTNYSDNPVTSPKEYERLNNTYGNYLPSTFMSNKKSNENSLQPETNATIEKENRESENKKQHTTPNPTLLDELSRSFSQDHAVYQIKDGWVSQSVVVYPTIKNLGEEFSILNLPPELMKIYQQQVSKWKMSEYMAFNPQNKFSYILYRNDHTVSQGNPPLLRVDFKLPGGKKTHHILKLPQEYNRPFTQQGIIYAGAREGYFRVFPTPDNEIVMLPYTPETRTFNVGTGIEEFMSNKEHKKAYIEILNTGILPKNMEKFKFKVKYMDSKGKIVTKKLNLLQYIRMFHNKPSVKNRERSMKQFLKKNDYFFQQERYDPDAKKTTFVFIRESNNKNLPGTIFVTPENPRKFPKYRPLEPRRTMIARAKKLDGVVVTRVYSKPQSPLSGRTSFAFKPAARSVAGNTYLRNGFSYYYSRDAMLQMANREIAVE